MTASIEAPGGPSAPCSRPSAPPPWPSCVSGMSGSIARPVEACAFALAARRPPVARPPVALDRHPHAAYGLRQRPRSAFGHGATSILAPCRAGGPRCFASGLVRAGRLDPRHRAFGLRLRPNIFNRSHVRVCPSRRLPSREREWQNRHTRNPHATASILYQETPEIPTLANNSPAAANSSNVLS